MPSLADITAFQALLIGLSTQAAARVAALTPEQAAELYPQLVSPYIDAAGVLSAQWYYDLAPTNTFAVEVAPPPAVDALFASARWAATQADPGQALGLATERRVFNQSRDTVALNATREKVRYSRYASANACDWCRMLAGRGAVYHTTEDAAASHDGCHCLAVPQRI